MGTTGWIARRAPEKGSLLIMRPDQQPNNHMERTLHARTGERHTDGYDSLSWRDRWEEHYESGETPWDTQITPPEVQEF